MAQVGETIDESELESTPEKSPSKSGDETKGKESLAEFWNQLKQGNLMQAGRSFPGSEKSIAAMTGALGPATAAAPSLAALLSSGQGGTFADRYKQAQKPLQQAVHNNPGSAVLGGLAGGILAPAPGLSGGASAAGKIGAGIANGAMQGGAQSFGLGQGVAPGAIAGGAIGGIGGGTGSLLSKAANSETLSPLINRLKFLKPSPEEAQPLSEAGQGIRSAIEDTSAQGMWKGMPSRQGMLERLQGAQAPAGKRIGDILKQADTVNAGLPEAGATVPEGVGGSRVTPDTSMPTGQSTLKSLLAHSSSSGDNPARLQDIAQQESQNMADSAGSLQSLNKAKQGIYAQTYTPNKPEMGDRFLPGRDQLLRSMGRDVKNSVQGSLNDLHEIDPSVDAKGFESANKQYGTLADLIGPLNRATGKDIAGGNNAHIYGGPTHMGVSMLGDMLNFGGKRQLLQAHLGEAAQGATKALSTYKPAQAVAKAFIAGTTPGINQEDEETVP